MKLLFVIAALGISTAAPAQSSEGPSNHRPTLSSRLGPSGLTLAGHIKTRRDGRSLLAFSAFVHGNWDIYVWNWDAANAPKQLTHTPYDEAAPSLASDGSFCVYESVDGKLRRKSLTKPDPPETLPFASDEHFDMHPAVSPNNLSVVMATNLDRATDDSDLVVYDFSSKSFRRHLELMSFQHYPTWAPDGRHVAFSNLHGRLQTGRPVTEIWAMRVDAPWAVQLTLLDAVSISPSWSPDGSLIVFASNHGGPFNIWVVDPVTRAYAQLTNEASADTDPVFSPDGRFILFVSTRGGRLGLWKMDRSGGAASPVTPYERDSNIPCKDPDWK